MRPYYYLGGNWALTQLSTGDPFFVNTDDRGIATWIILGGVWETFVDNVLCHLARPGDVFLDVGANLGYYTVKIGRIVGRSGRVHSFEPNPQIFPFLRENITINGMEPWVTAYPLAAGDQAGWSTLNVPTTNMGGGWMAAPAAQVGRQDAQVVPIVSIDSVVTDTRPVDLIKMDVEGFEPLALQGMQQILERSPQAALVLEVSFAHWARFGEPIEVLRGLAESRRIFMIHHDGALEERTIEDLQAALNPSFVCYVLLAPVGDPRLEGLV